MSDYEILGVSPNATKEEIKQAYRAAAKRLHPDVNDAPNAATMFRLVQEAYYRLEAGTPHLDDRPPSPVQQRAQPRTAKRRVMAWVLASLQFVLMLPILLVVNLLYVLCILITTVGETLMLGTACLCGILTLIALFNQIWYSFFTFLILTWLCSPIGVPALAAAILDAIAVLRAFCWNFATGRF